jgi:flavin-dependent dehydrogenase
MPKNTFDIIIIGGGLAGLTSATHLAKAQYNVLLVEKNSYPKHKVCGEYISNEVLPYLKSLGFSPFDYGATRINDFELTTHNNKTITAKLPLGGFGLSRYAMDEALYKQALSYNATHLQDTVTDVDYNKDCFKVTTKSGNTLHAKLVIGAYGKRSQLDVKLKRPFISKQSPYLAVKMHVSGAFPKDKVALHNFKGGYCGVSKVENNIINLCYISNYSTFKKYKDIEAFQKAIVLKNKALKHLFSHTKPEFTAPLTISQISFETKNPVEQHILMCGDTAGMIHPLCGNGMSMAIRSASIASQLIIKYLEGEIETREALEKIYTKQWKKTFRLRLKAGHSIAYLFRQDWLAPKLLMLLKGMPFLMPLIIKLTHGKSMTS